MNSILLKTVVLNLMPNKETTEQQIITLLKENGITPDITWLTTATYQSRHTDLTYLKEHYNTLEQIKNKQFDLCIITGAPVEHLDFENVIYWKELQEIFNFSKTNVICTVFICWAAQAALYHFFGINKYPLQRKCFGIFPQTVEQPDSPFLYQIENGFNMPHSRYSHIKREYFTSQYDLSILASLDSEPTLLSAFDHQQLYITGHLEYDTNTLHYEYQRDKEKGSDILPPKFYYLNNNASLSPVNCWRETALALYFNIIQLIINKRNNK
ncbi:MAG: homoserine O-succinyltransferase [Prevotellaceae bacterium]|jgi:homoserine O-succinyltransferase|nr:homoserine O-succinyltransferase [Prevotellaceae bacterium]